MLIRLLPKKDAGLADRLTLFVRVSLRESLDPRWKTSRTKLGIAVRDSERPHCLLVRKGVNLARVSQSSSRRTEGTP